MTDTLFELPEVPTNLGAAMAGGNGKRRENDFYPTEPEAIEVLLDEILDELEALAIIQGFAMEFHEPACGDGAISRVIEARGYPVLSTDLIYRGYGIGGVDYLKAIKSKPIVLTNPPFNVAREFIEKALADGAVRVYMLLKSTFFHAAGRADLFEGTPLKRVMPLSWRLDFTGQGCPTMECCWFEWEKGYSGQPTYGPILKRPKKVLGRCEKTVDLFEKDAHT